MISIKITVFILVGFSNLAFASNNDDRKLISLLDGALSTVEQAAQSGNNAINTVETVADGVTLTDIQVSH